MFLNYRAMLGAVSLEACKSLWSILLQNLFIIIQICVLRLEHIINPPQMFDE